MIGCGAWNLESGSERDMYEGGVVVGGALSSKQQIRREERGAGEMAGTSKRGRAKGGERAVGG